MAEPRTDTGSTPKLSNPNAPAEEVASGSIAADAPLDHLSKADAQQVQFPSLYGQPGVEIAERTIDTDKSATKVHRKVFRVFTYGLDFDASAFDHEPNFTGTRQFMVEHGLRPVGDVRFVGAERFDDKNTDLVYEVEALPTIVAVDPDVVYIEIPQDNPPTAA
jgi:hypothetical protein